MYEDNLELLKQRSRVKVFRHFVNINSPILPFRVDSRDQTKFDRGFDGIIGEFARISSDKSWDKNFDLNKIVDTIVLNDELEYNAENNEFLKSILTEYLAKDENVKVLHPYLFLYLSKTKNLRADNEKEIATFFRDVMFKDINNFNEFFNNKNSDNILIKLILNNLPELPNENTPFKYYSCLNFVTQVFKEDIEFIKDKPLFLINNLDNIFAFYYFYYCSQVVLKLNQSFKVDLENPSKIYSLLDWEKASKSRKSISEGYNILKESNKKLFINMVLIEHFNTILGTNALLINQLENLVISNQIDKENYFSCLKEWINYYETKHNLDYVRYFENFHDYVRIYHEDLEKCIRNQQNVGFSFNLENIGKKYFLKRRGQYGFALNITKDFLYLITALCVKEEKIKLNDLFKEYERRGLFFDRYSKEEVINLLNTWNLIDKKSDSGDAQYVKQIL